MVDRSGFVLDLLQVRPDSYNHEIIQNSFYLRHGSRYLLGCLRSVEWRKVHQGLLCKG